MKLFRIIRLITVYEALHEIHLIKLLVYLLDMPPSPPCLSPPPHALQASCNVNQDIAMSYVQLQSTHIKVDIQQRYKQRRLLDGLYSYVHTITKMSCG